MPSAPRSTAGRRQRPMAPPHGAPGRAAAARVRRGPAFSLPWCIGQRSAGAASGAMRCWTSCAARKRGREAKGPPGSRFSAAGPMGPMGAMGAMGSNGGKRRDRVPPRASTALTPCGAAAYGMHPAPPLPATQATASQPGATAAAAPKAANEAAATAAKAKVVAVAVGPRSETGRIRALSQSSCCLGGIHPMPRRPLPRTL